MGTFILFLNKKFSKWKVKFSDLLTEIYTTYSRSYAQNEDENNKVEVRWLPLEVTSKNFHHSFTSEGFPLGFGLTSFPSLFFLVDLKKIKNTLFIKLLLRWLDT